MKKNATPVERVEAWIAALRSGKYVQVTGGLRGEGDGGTGYCCLGVACKIAHPRYFSSEAYAQDSSYMPPDYAAEYGIDQRDQEDLSALNDDYGRTFAEIADVIESDILPRVREEQVASK